MASKPRAERLPSAFVFFSFLFFVETGEPRDA
jgi:hypothetical protein